MKITKYGHCCLRLRVGETVILIDPGCWSDPLGESIRNNKNEIFVTSSEKSKNLILLTHEHKDHLDIELLKEIIVQAEHNNAEVEIYTNASIQQILLKNNIQSKIIDVDLQFDKYENNDIFIKSHDVKHEEIYRELGQVDNVGFEVYDKAANRTLYYGGDSLQIPDGLASVSVLAAPIVAPWANIHECIDYIIAMSPECAIQVHDALLKDSIANGPGVYALPEKILLDHNIKYLRPIIGQEFEI